MLLACGHPDAPAREPMQPQVPDASVDRSLDTATDASVEAPADALVDALVSVDQPSPPLLVGKIIAVAVDRNLSLLTVDVGNNANVHFHTLVPEGVWYERTGGAVAFHALPPPTDEDVLALTERIVQRVAHLLRARDADATAADPPELDDLVHAQAEAVHVPRATRIPPASRATSRRRTALVDGFSLHADTGRRYGARRLHAA